MALPPFGIILTSFRIYHTSGEKFRKAGNLLGKKFWQRGGLQYPQTPQGGTNMKNRTYSLYQMALKFLTFYLGVDQEKKRVGRLPKVSDLQLCALFILSYITTLAKSLIDTNIKFYYLFRKTRI
jgi:hypothetical protein